MLLSEAGAATFKKPRVLPLGSQMRFPYYEVNRETGGAVSGRRFPHRIPLGLVFLAPSCCRACRLSHAGLRLFGHRHRALRLDVRRSFCHPFQRHQRGHRNRAWWYPGLVARFPEEGDITVCIVTDSICDLPRGVAAEYGITVVPFCINSHRRGYLDGVDLTRADFHARLPDLTPPADHRRVGRRHLR